MTHTQEDAMSRNRTIVISAVAGALVVGVGIGVAGVALTNASGSAAAQVASSAGHTDRGGMGGGSGSGGGMSGMSGSEASGAGMGGMSGMSGMEVTDEFSYLTMMIPHHIEAIEAAELLKAGTDRPEMREFAQTIIDTQSREVEQMRAWLAAWYPGQDTTVDYMPMMGDYTGLSGDALDRAFLEDMIPHHMAAVMMSQQFVTGDLADHPEVIPFAESIRDTQRAEIMMMHDWLAEWFGVTGMGGMGGGMGRGMGH